MKTIISFIAAVMTIAMVLTACGAEGTGPVAEPQAGAQEENQAGAQDETQEETGAVSVDVSSLKTFGDLFALKLPQKQLKGSVAAGDKFAYGFESDGVIYRAVGVLPNELFDKIFAIDHAAEDADAQEEELLKDLPIDSVDNLSEMMLTEDQIKTYIGKTGAEILEAGWKPGAGYDLGRNLWYMNYLAFSYEVVFEGESEELKKALDNPDIISDPEFNVTNVFESMTVKSISNARLEDLLFDVEQ